MKTKKKISIIIPAYNAAKHLESVIERIPETVWPDILNVWIINDGSEDSTKDVIKSLCKKNSCIHSINLPHNKGYGYAVSLGLRQCKKDKCDMVVCLHADGQYAPESIPDFIIAMDDQGLDIVQGSRIASETALKGGMPLYKYIAGKVLTFFENKVFNLNMSDFHSGYLVYSRKALDSLPYHRFSSGFNFDLEVIASARAHGLGISEIPIPTHYGDEISYLNPVSYGMSAILVMVKYLLNMYRRIK